MTELLPIEQADALRISLLEYLATTFNLNEEVTRQNFEEFLQDPQQGIFRGPYVRLRIPFAVADTSWKQHLSITPPFPPYGHQAAAFARLDSRVGRPKPTIVTTGTGSGKTEAFLLPILDHIVRAKRQGTPGVKALLLYPMNALANDQARRLAALISESSELQGVTAALYTGESGESKRTRVSEKGLITSRSIIQKSPPDILLTNYKMLDQLLLRTSDASIWRESAKSLTYLVLDEFHTYDGAQGTDVAMLLRRLGATLKSHWSKDDPHLTAADWARPLGKLTTVGTSATLGDDGDPASILEFAATITGEEIPREAVITETRLTGEQWIGDAPARIAMQGLRPVAVDRQIIDAVISAVQNHYHPDADRPRINISENPATAAQILLGHLYEGEDAANPQLTDASAGQLLDLVKAHPFFQQLLEKCARAVNFADLGRALLPTMRSRTTRGRGPEQFLNLVFAVLSHLRARCGRQAPNVDVHLWVRELTRIDRTVQTSEHMFRWSDDGVSADTENNHTAAFPALYCRHCGRSGWGILLAPTGVDLESPSEDIRRAHVRQNDRFRALIHAPSEAQESLENPSLRWLDVGERRLTVTVSDEDRRDSGEIVPVITHTGEEAGKQSVEDTCPYCETKDGIRFLGSAIATQLSVALGTLFGTEHMAIEEKKALVFTDSVQDAAHRAGFVGSRSHVLTLRSVIRDHISEDPIDITSLTEEILRDAGSDPQRRYRLLPPELATREAFAPFWQAPNQRNAGVLRRVRDRLAFDLIMEFGLRSMVGRTLEATDSVAVKIAVQDHQILRAARGAIAEMDQQQLGEIRDIELLRWVHAILLHMRQRGAIDHNWFEPFRVNDGNHWFIGGGRKRESGMPSFRFSRSTPSFPYTGKMRPEAGFEPVASARGWYALWTAKTLGHERQLAASLSSALFRQLAKAGILGTKAGNSGGITYHLRPELLEVSAATRKDAWEKRLVVACQICGAATRGTPEFIEILAEGPCLVNRCAGTLQPQRRGQNYYQRMYAARDPRRVVAREHTSLLATEQRLQLEEEFKALTPKPDSPNVLVATPTLEMGIDIGDLSTVMLSSMPKTVASYVQRIGRAGRLTGNSFSVAFMTARGKTLPTFKDPERTINGAVRPPVTYLEAEEILKRQYVAFAADTLARAGGFNPGKAADVLETTNSGSYLGAVIEVGEKPETAQAFLATFNNLRPEIIERFTAWASPKPGIRASSGLAVRCHNAAQKWSQDLEDLQYKLEAIDQALPELEEIAHSPAATDNDKAALRTTEIARDRVRRHITDHSVDFWISALEKYGLLPNYTLLDDSVELDASFSWIDTETGNWHDEDFTLERGSQQALRDFAPGSTFYSRGYAIEIDALDFAKSRTSARDWACCNVCGYVHDPVAADPTPRQCPRCGSSHIADKAQQLKVVELTHVSSVMRRDEAVIDDRADSRIQRFYQIVPLVDIDRKQAKSWFVEGSTFGVRYLANTTLRWINCGPAMGQGISYTISGIESKLALFYVCPECGHHNKNPQDQNHARLHRPWCTLRKEAKNQSIPIALSRTLQTEALVVRIPQRLTVGDNFTTPSLRAALRLALAHRLGGPPDHLDIVQAPDPSDTEGASTNALVIYDQIPGGTGYLADLSEPKAMWDLLYETWQILASCACADDNDDRIACEDCLLPYTEYNAVSETSRASAATALEYLVHGRADAAELPREMSWKTQTVEPEPETLESFLEQRLRHVLRQRLTQLGATIEEHPTSSGVRWKITMPGGAVWNLEPQKHLHGSRPDFVLSSARPDVPQTAIFTDGWSYHASESINRLADDSQKRAKLREAGLRVLSLTMEDLETAEAQAPWFDEQVRQFLLQTAGLSRDVVDLLPASPLEILVHWIAKPVVEDFQRLEQWLPVAFFNKVKTMRYRQLSPEANLSEIALASLQSGVETALSDAAAAHAGELAVALYRRDTVAFTSQVVDVQSASTRFALVLDDTKLGREKTDSWREWLHLSNWLASRYRDVVITVASDLQSLPPLPTALAPAPQLSPWWQEVLAEGWDDEEHEFLSTLATHHPELPQPEIGEEYAGIPVLLSWVAAKVAVLNFGAADEDATELSSLGWTVVEPDPGKVADALSEGA